MVFAAFPIHASQPHAFHGPFHKKYFVAFQPERSTNNTDDSKQTESSSAVNKNGCNTPCRRTGTETDNSSKPEARSCPNANKAGTDTETRRCPGATVLPRCFPKQQQATSQALKSRLHHEETPKVAKVSLDVTGFGAEDISIHVDEETFIVTVSGSRTNKLGDVFRLHRRFALDRKAAEVDKMSANLEGGILELVVPKKTTTGLRRIPIRVGSSESAGSKDSDSDSDTPTDTTGAEERVVEPSKVASDNNLEDNDEDKDKATDQPGQNCETDSVEVETVQEEEDDEDGDRDRDSDEEEHEEDSRSGESTENTILRTPSNETKDEESWMEVTK